MPEIRDVNIELGDDVSKMMYEASKQTHQNRPGLLVELHESFSGFRAIPGTIFNDPSNLMFNLGFDGVGTKVEVSERLEDHSVVAYDLFAMVCDDAAVRGAEPIAIGSILDVKQLYDNDETRQAIRQLALGYVAAAEAAGVVVVNGEVAELGDRIGGYAPLLPLIKRILAFIRRQDTHEQRLNYNWGATTLWVAHKDRVLTGHQIEPKQRMVGLPEYGFRSNGITDVRKAMQQEYGKNWHNKIVPELGSVSLGKLVQQPSTIFCKLVNELTGGYDIDKSPTAVVTGVAHITGGGQPSKLARMLEASGYGAFIDNPIIPPAIMKHVQELRGFSDKQAYGKWHMGPGMVIVTPEPEKVIAKAREMGIDGAQDLGPITEKPGLKIVNFGARQDQEILDFPLAA